MITNSPFWTALRVLTEKDHSCAVSAEATNRAKAIFEPPQPVRYLTLQPAFGGMVRQAGAPAKFLYETNGDFMVQLETNSNERSWKLSGMLVDTDGPFNVTLFGLGILEEATKIEDQFQFDDLGPGDYRLCFEQEGATFWIKSLQIGNQPQEPRPA